MQARCRESFTLQVCGRYYVGMAHGEGGGARGEQRWAAAGRRGLPHDVGRPALQPAPATSACTRPPVCAHPPTCVFSARGWKPHFSKTLSRTRSGVIMGVNPAATTCGRSAGERRSTARNDGQLRRSSGLRSLPRRQPAAMRPQRPVRRPALVHWQQPPSHPATHLVHRVIDQRQLQQRRLVPQVIKLGAGDLAVDGGGSTRTCVWVACAGGSLCAMWPGHASSRIPSRRACCQHSARGSQHSRPLASPPPPRSYHAPGLKVDEIQVFSQLQVVLGLKGKALLLPHQLQLRGHVLAADGHICGRPDEARRKAVVGGGWLPLAAAVPLQALPLPTACVSTACVVHPAALPASPPGSTHQPGPTQPTRMRHVWQALPLALQLGVQRRQPRLQPLQLLLDALALLDQRRTRLRLQLALETGVGAAGLRQGEVGQSAKTPVYLRLQEDRVQPWALCSDASPPHNAHLHCAAVLVACRSQPVGLLLRRHILLVQRRHPLRICARQPRRAVGRHRLHVVAADALRGLQQGWNEHNAARCLACRRRRQHWRQAAALHNHHLLPRAPHKLEVHECAIGGGLGGCVRGRSGASGCCLGSHVCHRCCR